MATKKPNCSGCPYSHPCKKLNVIPALGKCSLEFRSGKTPSKNTDRHADR